MEFEQERRQQEWRCLQPGRQKEPESKKNRPRKEVKSADCWQHRGNENHKAGAAAVPGVGSNRHDNPQAGRPLPYLPGIPPANSTPLEKANQRYWRQSSLPVGHENPFS
jgi:hypothetical protein